MSLQGLLYFGTFNDDDMRSALISSGQEESVSYADAVADTHA